MNTLIVLNTALWACISTRCLFFCNSKRRFVSLMGAFEFIFGGAVSSREVLLNWNEN